MISVDDFLFFVDEALAEMVAIVTELGDELANRRPDAPAINSPYVVLSHCLGVMEYWAGQVIAGRSIDRNRDAEFQAAGTVQDLVAQVHRARQQLQADIANLEPFAAPGGTVDNPEDADLPLGRTQGGVLMHIYSELAQHRGQMETCRDVLLTRWVQLASATGATPQPDNRYRSADGVDL
jgi:hypothetical protein